ncbi:general secretion pathway protein GspF [Teredinibacter haidensis]|uniref:general secretion pathway protein GspF n=1 Tax=Teredinibacter haidensis TaxID=2731755 RepID=UPI0009488E39|nr:general secretion pathway protein GspF [Teredinibacter haidensis]
MARRNKFFRPDEPLAHADHHRPKTRRDFIAQGFQAGLGTVVGSSVFSLFANPREAMALSSDIDIRKELCGITAGAGKIPFICFDLAGGANIAGSNVLIGGQGGQMDFLSTAGYSKQGLPGDMIPGLEEANPIAGSNGDHTNTQLGLAFHADSGYLRGILERTAAGTQQAINGAVIPARSENDTGNNPHNPMYAINMAGANGELLALAGSRTSDSGGNSAAPADLINNEVRPTKIDRPSDVTGLVDVGDFGSLSSEEIVAVMESVSRISDEKLARMSTGMSNDKAIKDMVSCAYVKSAYLAENFPDPGFLDPATDPDIVGASGIFSVDEFNSDREFQKAASVMKLVVNGYAGAGTITMGGYDYHTGDRSTGEMRDLRAGRCMGACLEYAARRGVPLMMYVFSDGSVFSNGMTDDSMEGRGKGVWTGDNQQTAGAFFLVYNPGGRPVLMGTTPEEQAIHQQIGYMRASGDVETNSSGDRPNPAANNINLLVQTVMLNYMALHGEQGQFESAFTSRGLSHGLGSAGMMDRITAFNPIVGGTNI